MLNLKVGDEVKIRRIVGICCTCGWPSYSNTPYYTRWVVDSKYDNETYVLKRYRYDTSKNSFLAYWPSKDILAGDKEFFYHEIYKINGKYVRSNTDS